MLTDAELFHCLPSHQTEVLAKAIGRRLHDIERLFILGPEDFLADSRYQPDDFFVYNSGAVQFSFDDSLIHPLAVWGEQLSLVLLPEPLQDPPYGRLYRLSETLKAPGPLRDCLGKVCLDVRIWTLQEDFESEEAKEAAVSYHFENGRELFYVIYLHGDADSDFLLTGDQVPRHQVARCYSIAQGGAIDPQG